MRKIALLAAVAFAAGAFVSSGPVHAKEGQCNGPFSRFLAGCQGGGANNSGGGAARPQPGGRPLREYQPPNQPRQPSQPRPSPSPRPGIPKDAGQY